MATIDKKLIHFNRLADFEARLAAGDIRDYSIVCIKDAKLIWTHGEYYGDLSECLKVTQQTLTDEERRQVQENLGYYFLEWDGESETIQLADEEYEKLKNATKVVLVYDIIMLYPIGCYSSLFLSYQLPASYEGLEAINIAFYENPITIQRGIIPIPTATSQLENDSDFVSAVDTGTEVDEVDVTYVTEAAMNAALSGKQENLVSGTNIKTINGQSILGEGDLTIEGGNVDIPTKVSDLENDSGFVGKSALGYIFDDNIETSGIVSAEQGVQSPLVGADSTSQLYVESDGSISTYNSNEDRVLEIIGNGDGTKFLANDGSYKTIETSGGSSSGGAYAEVNHGTSDTTFTLTPNTFHVWDEVASLDLSFGAETSGVANEYLFQFTSGATATTLTLPSDIKWANDAAPTIAENMIYQISVLRGLASVLEFSHEVSVFPATLVKGDNGQLGIDVYVELHSLAQFGSGVLNEGDLNLSVDSTIYPVTEYLYTEIVGGGYILHDTGMEYYILLPTGEVYYFFYD